MHRGWTLSRVQSRGPGLTSLEVAPASPALFHGLDLFISFSKATHSLRMETGHSRWSSWKVGGLRRKNMGSRVTQAPCVNPTSLLRGSTKLERMDQRKETVEQRWMARWSQRPGLFSRPQVCRKGQKPGESKWPQWLLSSCQCLGWLG